MSNDHTAMQRSATSAAALRGNKVPHGHRIYLVDGRVLHGELHRSPNVRLADHLAGLKGLISLTDARCERTGAVFPHVVVNLENVLFIEEMPARSGAA